MTSKTLCLHFVAILIAVNVAYAAVAVPSFLRNFDITANWCCRVEPPAQPLFTADGHLIGYIPQPCPDHDKVCCKGHINILGYCLTLELVQQKYPEWQEIATSQGIPLNQVVLEALVG